MIEWGGLAANSLWILGCALALATISYASWQASLAGIKLSAQLKRPQLQAGFSLAGLLFCAGLSLTSDVGWRLGLWAILGVFFLIQLIVIVRSFHVVAE